MKKVLLSLLCSAAFAAASPVSVSIADNNFVGPDTLKIYNQDVPAMSLEPTSWFVSGSWTANITSLTSSNLSNTDLANHNYTIDGHTLSRSGVYQAEAYLFSEMLQPNSDRVDLQSAAWKIMADTDGLGWLIPTNYTANADIENALAHYNTVNLSDFEIISPTANCFDPEFIATPEPGSVGLLGGALLALGIFGIRSKRMRAALPVKL